MCEHGYKPSLKDNGCPFQHSKLKADNTKRLWGTVIKYLDERTIQTISSNYKSIKAEQLALEWA